MARLPDLVQLHDCLARCVRRLGVLDPVVDLDVELARVVLALAALEHTLYDRTCLNPYDYTI